MATEQEIFELVYRTKGEEELQRLVKLQESLTEEIRQQAGAFGTLNQAMLSSNPALRKKAEELLATQQAMNSLDRSLGSGRSKMAGFGQSVMQASRGIQDMQYGLHGMVNNVEGFVMAMGGGAGLAGTLTLVAVGLQIMGPKLKTFFESFVGGSKEASDEIGRLKKRIDEIEASPVKLAVDARELDVAKRKLDALEAAKKAFDELSREKTTAEQESGKLVKDAVAEGAGPGGLRGLVQAMGDSVARGLISRDATIRQAREEIERKRASLEEARNGPGGPGQARYIGILAASIENLQKSIAERSAAITTGAETSVGGILAGAFSGGAAEQKQLAALLEQVGRGDLAEAARKNSPEAIAAERDRQQEEEFNDRRNQEALKLWQWQQEQQEKQRKRELDVADRQSQALAEDQDAEARRVRDAARDAKEAEQRAKEAEQRAKADAAQFGGGLGPQIQKALLRGADPRQLAGQAASQMRAAGLDADRAAAAGQAEVAARSAELQARLAELQNQGFRREQATLQVMGEIQQSVFREQQQSAALWGQLRQIQANQQMVNRPRGRVFQPWPMGR